MILRLATDRLLESVATGTDNFIFWVYPFVLLHHLLLEKGKREKRKAWVIIVAFYRFWVEKRKKKPKYVVLLEPVRIERRGGADIVSTSRFDNYLLIVWI